MKKRIVRCTLMLCLMVLTLGTTQAFADTRIDTSDQVKFDSSCQKKCNTYCEILNLGNNFSLKGDCDVEFGKQWRAIENLNYGTNCKPEVKPNQKPEVKPEAKPETKPEMKPTAPMGNYEKQIADIVNKERSKAGLKPLKVDSKLANVAEVKAKDMRDNKYFSHTSPTYGSPFDMIKESGIKYTSAGENIAKGQKTPESVMNGWMNSPGHKANILNNKYEQIGVGYVTDDRGNTYWVQMFIK